MPCITACTLGTIRRLWPIEWILADVPSSGNAFALFLKSQRKWENPPLQDDHRDQFRQLCLEHKYDGAK
ncbi:hypothetical protein GCM10025794_30100 [Massilia kyonggiensis]|jgi:hypothetical protein